MRRFILPSADLAAPELTVTDSTFHHMAHVLRLKEGAHVLIADGMGAERPGVIRSLGPDSLAVHFNGEPSLPSPPLPAITIYQGLPKGEKMDFIVQKCTELGVATIVPFSAARSIKKVRPERSAELVGRWQKIAGEAGRQSGSRIPAIRWGGGIAEAIRGNSAGALKLLLWEEEQVVTLRELITSVPEQDEVEVIIGPEGGITPFEVDEARRQGFKPVSLGRSILRTETAGLVIVSILQFQWGNLGGR